MNRLPNPPILVAFAPLVLGSDEELQDFGGMSKEKVANSVGTFDDEGAFCLSSLLIFDEGANARSLRARYGRDGRRHAWGTEPVSADYRRLRPDAASAARIRWARAFARL